MTRPMPGPPQWHESAGLGDWDAQGRWRNRWNLYWKDGRGEFDVPERHDKRLTGVECDAECWRADADYQTERLADIDQRLHDLQRTLLDERPAAPPPVAETRAQARRRWKTWHRFAHTPHALETTT